MDRRKLILLLAVVVIIIGGFIYYFYKNTLNNGLTASGTIEVTDVTVSSKVVARVLEVKVDEGSQVKAGDTLAVLDPSELQQALNGAQAKYQIAKDDFARNKQLMSDKMISPQQYDAASSAMDVAKAALDTAQIQLDNAVIKAPIAGVRMTDIDIEVNDAVLTIRGQRRQTDAVPADQFYLQECFFGPFTRSVTLPCIIDPKRVRATFSKECVLKILVPKEEKVKIVKINEG